MKTQYEGKETMYKTAYDNIGQEFVSLMDWDADTATYLVSGAKTGSRRIVHIDNLSNFCL